MVRIQGSALGSGRRWSLAFRCRIAVRVSDMGLGRKAAFFPPIVAAPAAAAAAAACEASPLRALLPLSCAWIAAAALSFLPVPPVGVDGIAQCLQRALASVEMLEGVERGSGSGGAEGLVEVSGLGRDGGGGEKESGVGSKERWGRRGRGG